LAGGFPRHTGDLNPQIPFEASIRFGFSAIPTGRTRNLHIPRLAATHSAIPPPLLYITVRLVAPGVFPFGDFPGRTFVENEYLVCMAAAAATDEAIDPRTPVVRIEA
jgi:hypothetical protein